MKLDFKAPFTQFFGHPKWGVNWLLLTVCFLIPMIGPIVVLGWLLRCFVAWLEDRPVPEFDFQYFLEYLKQGLWPFLVSLVAIVAVMIVFVPVFLVAVVGIVTWAGEGPEGPEGPEVAVMVLLTLGLLAGQFLLFAIMGFFLTPAMLRSGLKQDFAEGFAFGFVFDFIKRTWIDLVLVQLALSVMWLAGILVGYMAFFFGLYFVVSLLMFVQWHLHFQIYRIYLEKGGEEIPVDPALRQIAPPLATGVPPALPPDPGGSGSGGAR